MKAPPDEVKELIEEAVGVIVERLGLSDWMAAAVREEALARWQELVNYEES